MNQGINCLKSLPFVAFFMPIPASAGCVEYGTGQVPGHPRVILCYKGKCDDTTLDTVCGNAFRDSFQYANGLTVYRAEGANQTSEFSNTLGKKMSGKDWTCKTVGTTVKGQIEPCALFQAPKLAALPAASGKEDATQKPSDPAGVVSTAIKLDGQNTPLFSEKPKGRMTEFFTKGFIAAWDAAFENNKGQPFMDGDPISGVQTLKSLTPKSIKVESASDTEARVAATVFVQSDRSGDENLTFNLKRESGVWKIDDIGSPVEPSLHGYLVKSSH
jgi:Protein of unknown function (DUF3828)